MYFEQIKKSIFQFLANRQIFDKKAKKARSRSKIDLHVFAFLFIVVVFVAMRNNAIDVYAASTINNRDDFSMMLYETFLEREKTLTIEYTGSDSDTIYNEIDKIIFCEVAAYHNPESTDDVDYICGNLARYRCQYYKYNKGGKFIFDFSYHETSAETQIVNSQVKSIIANMHLNNKSTYEKVKAIHDYIIKYVSYDNTYSNYSAYSALINKSAVCNGYALLAYKMLTYANVPCKYVTGYINENGISQEHAWNLVQVDGKWYNMDITWDDTDVDNEFSYCYFLKGNINFEQNHIRHKRYSYVLFQTMYPVVNTDYEYKSQNILTTSTNHSISLSDISLSFTKKTLKRGKKISLTIKNKSNLKSIKRITYRSTKSKIASVTSKGKISARKKGKANIKTTVSLIDGQKKTFTAKIIVK